MKKFFIAVHKSVGVNNKHKDKTIYGVGRTRREAIVDTSTCEEPPSFDEIDTYECTEELYYAVLDNGGIQQWYITSTGKASLL